MVRDQTSRVLLQAPSRSISPSKALRPVFSSAMTLQPQPKSAVASNHESCIAPAASAPLGAKLALSAAANAQLCSRSCPLPPGTSRASGSSSSKRASGTSGKRSASSTAGTSCSSTTIAQCDTLIGSRPARASGKRSKATTPVPPEGAAEGVTQHGATTALATAGLGCGGSTGVATLAGWQQALRPSQTLQLSAAKVLQQEFLPAQTVTEVRCMCNHKHALSCALDHPAVASLFFQSHKQLDCTHGCIIALCRHLVLVLGCLTDGFWWLLLQAQERGETVQIQDDAQFALDGLSPSSSLSTQRDCAVSLAEMLATRKGRLALRWAPYMCLCLHHMHVACRLRPTSLCVQLLISCFYASCGCHTPLYFMCSEQRHLQNIQCTRLIAFLVQCVGLPSKQPGCTCTVLTMIIRTCHCFVTGRMASLSKCYQH